MNYFQEKVKIGLFRTSSGPNRIYIRHALSEAATGWCSIKKLFLKILQYYQENNCVAEGLQLY